MKTTVASLAPGAPAALAALFVFVGAARAAEPGGNPDKGGKPLLAVPTHRGVEVFRADTPEAKTSAAARSNDDLADKAGQIPPPTGGFTLTATVVVQAIDLTPAQATIAAAGASAAPFGGIPSFWLVTSPSVRAAADLASALLAEGRVQQAYVDVGFPMPLRDAPPSDPGYPQQWHLNNTTAPVADLNVVPVWAAGFTGSGVTVGQVEDGFFQQHPDLINNYNAAASMTGTSYTSHGVSVAGLVAAQANNGLGGAGVAYNGRIAKIYRGVTSTDHATAFAFLNDLNQVKTNSWGPPDNGIVATMAPEERAALQQAVTTGRGGLGTVICWAAGNGGTGDRCDYDPYVSCRYTIAVGAIDDTDARAYYNESGSSMFVVTPSSSDGSHRGIYSTTGTSGYTTVFGGTSASSPEAASVVALMLQANPNLTWRDVKHILARTARRNDPANPGWTVNAGGRHISYDYGFGGLDAGAAVTLAQEWRNVPAETSYVSGLRSVGQAIPDNTPAGVTQSFAVPADFAVEAVEVVLNITHPTVGDLRVVLTSPSGTTSVLAVPRPDGTDNYNDYIFTSSRNWDERSIGTWTLRVSDEVTPDAGTWNSWQLRVYGNQLCRADWDHSGAVDPADLALYVQHWLRDVGAGTSVSNQDGDPAVTPADLAAFVGAWYQAINSGC